MKKQYIQPANKQYSVPAFVLVDLSVQVNNEVHNNVSGDTKEAGDWNGIWE